VPLLEGRGFQGQDTPESPAVVVVNQGFAERYFTGMSAVGRKFSLGGREVTIIGVAGNGRYDYREIDNDRLPLVYYDFHQTPSSFVTFHIRAERAPFALFPAVQSAIAGVDPAITLLPATTLTESAGVPFAVSRSALQILVVLGLAALLLASMGLFSVMSYEVTLRTRELGIRVALGATAPGIVRLVLGRSLRLVVAGTAAGIVAALFLLAGLRDRLTFLPDARLGEYLLPALLLGAAALVASLLPARRATALDPIQTLRTD
jgi:hypothetical protein